MSNLFNFFDQIYIINLPHRIDRKNEIKTQLDRAGLKLDSGHVRLFPAFRPDSQAGFTSVGARGCFLSHLGVLREAQERGYNRILILEDDLNFSKDFLLRIPKLFNILSTRPWSIFYGGHRILLDQRELKTADDLVTIPPNCGVSTTHMIAFQDDAVDVAIKYLEAILMRPAGSSEGGPMHVDGAYSWMRRAHPELVTLAAVPVLGYQRPSSTDIHSLNWFDRWPGFASLTAAGRRLKAHWLT